MMNIACKCVAELRRFFFDFASFLQTACDPDVKKIQIDGDEKTHKDKVQVQWTKLEFLESQAEDRSFTTALKVLSESFVWAILRQSNYEPPR